MDWILLLLTIAKWSFAILAVYTLLALTASIFSTCLFPRVSKFIRGFHKGTGLDLSPKKEPWILEPPSQQPTPEPSPAPELKSEPEQSAPIAPYPTPSRGPFADKAHSLDALTTVNVFKPGAEAEKRISKLLSGLCKRTHTHLFDNVTLKLKDGSTTQIDHVLVSQKGVLVVETKDYSGWIYGRYNAPKWTQVLYGKKSQFQNPTHQNYKHIQAIYEVLPTLPERMISGVVVFTDRSELKTPKPNRVIHEGELDTFFQKLKSARLTVGQIKYCLRTIENARMAQTEETELEHVQNLQQRFNQPKENICAS